MFKIVFADPKNPYAELCTNARAALFHYYGDNGVDTVWPVPNARGNLTEMISADGAAFIAYTYALLPGEHPDPRKWDEGTIRAWGRTVGRTHRLTKGYPVREGVDVPGGKLLHWRSELMSFLEKCGDKEVKAAWLSMRERVEKLPLTRDTFGFIHNDPHMQNVLVYEDRVSLLDFDVASCHFFAADIAIAIQSVLFTLGGGIDRPVQNPAPIRIFKDAFLAGYRQENELPPEVEGAIELFVAYRRLLLFTVMEEWLSAKPEIRDSMKKLIREEPRVLGM